MVKKFFTLFIHKFVFALGYARVILAILSFIYISRPLLFLPLYSLSCLLDAVDGHAARLLDQCSKLGAVLDMVTDRSTTAGLTAYLAHIYPEYMAGFLVLIGLDLSSHYMHMYRYYQILIMIKIFNFYVNMNNLYS